MSQNHFLTNLNYLLADLYLFREGALRVVRAAGLRPSFINFNTSPINLWSEIVAEANTRDKISNLISAALQDYPQNRDLLAAAQGKLTQVNGLVMDDNNWKADFAGDELEKILGEVSTLLPISYLATGMHRAQAVARVQLPDGGLGSGFLTANNIFVTNHHVIDSPAIAGEAQLQFRYELSETGLPFNPVVMDLAPEKGFLTSNEDDWTLVKVNGPGNEQFGQIEVSPIRVQTKDRVSIIQHPGGRHKEIGLHRNMVLFVGEKRVQYLTDTEPGSSGSPVFNNQWQLVAIHHSGGRIRVPGTEQKAYRNEGIDVNCIVGPLEELQ